MSCTPPRRNIMYSGILAGYRLLPLLSVARAMYPVLAPASLVPPPPTCARQLLYPLPRGATGHATCGMGAWGQEWDEGRAPGFPSRKRSMQRLSFAQSLTVLTVTPKEREQHEQHQDQQHGSSRQKEGKSLRNEARSRVGNKSLMKILGPFLLILS
ncbi:hypothetical protein LA080_015440 [Diaporthe eres]|nr:hypothetical protein LA080_015440 [Diaporthe eres]